MQELTLVAVQSVSSYAMFGVIWLVQLLVYPAFRLVPPEHWARLHAHHGTRISWVVIPLMLVELASALFLLAAPPAALESLQPLLAGCVALAWVSTFAIQVPLHQRLARGHDPRAIERLIQTNWIRTAAWTLKAALLLATGG